jgi:RNA polymerase-binding transcription factor DksA
MATKKAPVKKTVKKDLPKGKGTTAPAKKVVPAKKVTAPKKVTSSKKELSKQVAKKTVSKPIAKVAAKKATQVMPKSAVKPAPIKTAKPVAKKVAVKSAPSKPGIQVAKPTAKVTVQSINKSIAKTLAKNAATQKQATIVTKKIETKKPAAKPVAPAKAVPEKAVAKATEKVATKTPPAKPVVQKPVVLPKINTKTSRKYEPDFTKSVLDKAPVDPGAPIVMYSDADLAEFKELIQRKLGSAKKELAYLQGLITRKDDMGGDEGDGRYMTMEDGSLSMEREQLSQMASRQITFVDHLEKALMRIENKTYGVCRITGKLIDKARLRAVPHATLSIEAKMSGGK